MSTRPPARRKNPLTGLYYPNLVPMSAIRRIARQIAERFHPDKIILFGSYAYGTPTPDSDVDLLVIMPTRNQIGQAVRIDEALEPGFPMDLIVRTPRVLEQRLRWGDWFLREITERGKMLYEKTDARMARKGRRRPGHRTSASWNKAAHE
jgi:predicted nucleotidyltransferase